MTKMSKILWEGHALSTLHLPPRLWGLDFEPPPLQISGYATGQCNWSWSRLDRPRSYLSVFVTRRAAEFSIQLYTL